MRAERVAAIRARIDGQAMLRMSSTALFQHTKTFLLDKKALGRLLSTTEDLFRAFLRTTEATKDTEDLRAPFETCVSLIEARGLIRRRDAARERRHAGLVGDGRAGRQGQIGWHARLRH